MNRNRHPGIRASGEGSWEIKFDLPRDATGKRRTRFITFRGTKAEATAERDRLKTEARAGGFIEPSKKTLNNFIDEWIKSSTTRAESGDLARTTLERYVQILDLHVRPRLGAMPIQKLHSAHLSEAYTAIMATGKSARTTGHVHRVLHGVLAEAKHLKVVSANVAADVKPPKVKYEETEILSPELIKAVLTHLRGKTLYMPVALALATGMRRGELLALRWADVDLDGAKLKVERSLEHTKAGGLRFKSPKSRHGRRTITLPASTVADLRAHWKAQQELRLSLGMGKSPADGLVLCRYDGNPLQPSSISRQWWELITGLGLPRVRFHSLRHTHASHLIASGLDVVTISRRLGHGSPNITLAVYAHLMNATDDRAAKVMDAMLAQARTE